MDQAEAILKQLRESGQNIQVVSGDDHWIMFASRNGIETSVRGDDYLRVVLALAVAVGFICDPNDSGDERKQSISA